MSTILNTLKKLEEEKSVLEKNIDLKGLLLQGPESVYPQVTSKQSRKWTAIGGLIVGGVLLGALVAYFFNASKVSPPEIKNAFVYKPPARIPTIKQPFASAKTSPGFPLSGIPESKPAITDDRMDSMTEDEFRDDDFFGPEDALILPVEPASPVAAETSPEGSEEIREIETLVQTATANSEIETVVGNETPPAGLNHSLNIPGLKVKGIIFLNSDNPVNHIFVSTLNEKNRKLKVGETLSGATLEAVEAQKAIFSYQGQRVEKVIGE